MIKKLGRKLKAGVEKMAEKFTGFLGALLVPPQPVKVPVRSRRRR